MSNLQSLGDEWLYAKQEKKPYSPRYFLTLLILTFLALTFLVFRDSPAAIRLGLDLRGGTTIVLQPQQTEAGKITAESIAQALEILRKRVDGVGVSESEIRAEGSGTSTKIIVSVPGTTERELVNLVGQTAKLSIRPVLFVGSNGGTTVPTFPEYITQEMQNAYLQWSCPKDSTSASDDISVFFIACDDAGATKYILASSTVEGSQINDAQFALDQGALGWVTNLSFDAKGKIDFGDLSTNISKLPSPRNQMAVVLDGKVIIAPRVDGPLTGGQVRIYGGFTQEYAKNLSNILKYGALPFSFRVDEVEQISASLGASQLKSGLTAGALGLLLISIYLLVYYRALGILAIGSLAVAFIITLLLFVLLGRWVGLTLTLAGIAGAIVSIGVTADSFIVYFERVRDEMRQGASLRLALEKGWQRAKRTVWIADAVSLLAALILYLFTTGNVRGFAFTLGITTLIDLFIVYFFTRPILVLLQRYPFFSSGHRLSGLSQSSLGIVTTSKKRRTLDLSALGGRLFRGESSVSVVDRPRRWFILSGTFLVASAISLSVFGLNLGLEFKGGSVNVVTAPSPSPDKARAVLDDIGYTGQSIIQEIGGTKLRIETSQLSNDDATKLSQGLAQAFNVDIATIDSQNVGPSWGAEISRKALQGLFWFIVVLMIYLTFALEIRMALAAILAVIHDVFITVGLYAATGLKVTPAAVIGFLTILGYSLYDTVVVFDKVRENVLQMKRKGTDEYKKAVNLALNQTLIRSINTSVVAVIPIASILIIGAIFLKAETLKDISLALVIGQTIGTYSSIFIAAPLLVKLNAKRSNQSRPNEIIDFFAQPKNESRVKAAALGEEISLPSHLISAMKTSDAADVFRALFEQPEAWKTLWIDKRVSESLEEFTNVIRDEKSRSFGGRPLSVVRSSDTNGLEAIVTVELDSANESASLVLVATLTPQTDAITNLCAELREHLRSKSYTRFTIWSYDIPRHNDALSSLPLIEEGSLSEAFKIRSGRCNARVFKYSLTQDSNN